MNRIVAPVAQSCAVLALTLALASAASAAVIFPHVTNVNDTGAGSLRAAITAANANGPDGAIISFDIGSGCGPHVIHLNTPLPDLTAEVHIEGYTQTGSSKNTSSNVFIDNAVICIVLAGDNNVADGLTVPASVADSMEMSVLGVAFSGFTHAAVNLRGGSNHLFAGNRTGGHLSGFSIDTDSYGVIIAAGVHGVTVGGTDPGDVNQLADITHNAVYIDSSNASNPAAHGNTITYNRIGYVADAAGNSVDLPTGGASMAIGGYANTITYNYAPNSGASGLHISNLDAHGNIVEYNDFAGSAGDGILIDDDAHDNTILGNGMFNNAGAGIRVVNGQNNDIVYNNIDYNIGIGIDLAEAGPTPNDNDSMQPAPDYANRGLNFPLLQSAAGAHTGTVTGMLTTIPGDYVINLYGTTNCSAGGFGGGQNYFAFPLTANGMGYKVTVPNLTAQGQGSVGFSIPVTLVINVHTPLYVTATTTDSAGNTSEFSSCFLYQNDSIFFNGFE